MSTVAYANMVALAKGWEKAYRSAVCSGIRGDARHARNGGYHMSRQDNPRGNYSIVRRDDGPGKGPDNAAAAIDMSMNRADMILCTRRMMAVYDDVNDPRRKYVNAFNGWLGSGDAIRLDIVAHARKKATPDHKWHCHKEVRRVYVLSTAMVKAVLSALRGETKAQYLASIGVTPPAKPVGKPGAAKTPTPPKWPGHVLHRGMNNDPNVKAWQERMLVRGWRSLGKADGDFGPKTESVARRYQQTCRVPVNGKIDQKTWPLPWTRPL